ncbi:MAG TPA: aminotransferase, partial [Acidobacteriota bacterium]|nr:aminotransferase [Acidobacteriota bacterium]
MNRRGFLSLAAPATGFFPQLRSPEAWLKVLEVHQSVSGEPETIARDESFWEPVRRAFEVDRGLINLNNGGVSPSIAGAHRLLQHYLDTSNLAPSYYM